MLPSAIFVLPAMQLEAALASTTAWLRSTSPELGSAPQYTNIKGPTATPLSPEARPDVAGWPSTARSNFGNNRGCSQPAWGVNSLFYAAHDSPSTSGAAAEYGRRTTSTSWDFDELGMFEVPLEDQLCMDQTRENIQVPNLKLAAADFSTASSTLELAGPAAPTPKKLTKTPAPAVGAVIHPPSSASAAIRIKDVESAPLVIDDVFAISASKWLKSNIICNSSLFASEGMKSEEYSALQEVIACTFEDGNWTDSFTLNNILLGSLGIRSA